MTGTESPLPRVATIEHTDSSIRRHRVQLAIFRGHEVRIANIDICVSLNYKPSTGIALTAVNQSLMAHNSTGCGTEEAVLKIQPYSVYLGT
jgi:hypothetical protein